MEPVEIKMVPVRPSVAAELRLPGIGLVIVAVLVGSIGFLADSGAPVLNVLMASALLAVLGALLIAVSLAAYVFEARDLAALHALAEETRRNIAVAQRLAGETRANREARMVGGEPDGAS